MIWEFENGNKEKRKNNIKNEDRWTEIGSKRRPKIYLNKFNESKSILFHICALLAITINIFVFLFFVSVSCFVLGLIFILQLESLVFMSPFRHIFSFFYCVFRSEIIHSWFGRNEIENHHADKLIYFVRIVFCLVFFFFMKIKTFFPIS